MEKKRKRCAHEEKNERKTIPLHKQVPMSVMNMNVRMAECRLAYVKQGARLKFSPFIYIRWKRWRSEQVAAAWLQTERTA